MCIKAKVWLCVFVCLLGMQIMDTCSETSLPLVHGRDHGLVKAVVLYESCVNALGGKLRYDFPLAPSMNTPSSGNLVVGSYMDLDSPKRFMQF